MALVSYQTITLSKGKHLSPMDGACVMELASMLAGEPFNDHPQSVCPVIGSLLRAYNDRIDDRRRQDLYAYAAKVVGSRASRDVQHARAERLRAWALEQQWSRWLQRLVPARLRALVPIPPADLVGSHAVCAIPRHSDKTHAEVLALIDELLRIGAGKPPTARRAQTARRGRLRAAALVRGGRRVASAASSNSEAAMPSLSTSRSGTVARSAYSPNVTRPA